MRHRSNQDWIDELSGRRGERRQRLAFEHLGRRLYTSAYRFLAFKRPAVRLLADLAPSELQAMAQDAAQDTLEKLCDDDFALLERYRQTQTGSFEGFALAITVNGVRHYLRHRGKDRPLPAEEEGQEEGDPWWRFVRFLIDRRPESDPQQEALRQEVWEALQAGLQTLPARQRSAFEAHYLRGEPVSSVARHLGCSTNAVHMLLWKARCALRDYLRAAGLGPDA